MKVPKYVTELIACGEIALSKNSVDDFEGQTFRIFSRNGTENHHPRSDEKTMALVKKIHGWAIRNGAQSKIGEQDWLWWNPYDQYWERLNYYLMGISEPVCQELKEALRTENPDELEGSGDTVQKRPVLERSRIKLINKAPEGFSVSKSDEKLVGYFRADYDGYKWWHTWWESHGDLKTPEVKAEINQIGTEVIYRMFPGGLFMVEDYCVRAKAESIGQDEYNMYYCGERCNYWIRFIIRFRDYNIYLKCYAKEESPGTKDHCE